MGLAMSKPLGRGLLQSLRARVDADVLELVRGNRSLRRARYGPMQRSLRLWIVDRPAVGLIVAYGILLGALVLIEWAASHFAPSLLSRVTDADFTKDAASLFLAAQVGILVVLTVAISVVSLLTQRDDGSAVNTDVRLYYFESYAYELGTSAILLSIVLVVQLFWPLQPLVAFIAGDKSVDQFKFSVTVIHAAWLILNFYLFLHFINTTLRFVEPQSRARLRKQYSANEIIPRDVRRRLMGVYYANAPAQIFGAEEVKKGPLISFGMGLISDQQAVTEISRSFKAPSRLVDVWLLPLGFALRRWQQRTRKQSGPQKRFGKPHWDGHLAVLTDFARVHDGKSELVVREGGSLLTRFERMLMRMSLRFTTVDPREDSLPTPTDFIEQLISKVVSQIDAGSPNGFDDALKEAVDFHSFVLEAQNTRDEGGLLVNLAQVYDGPFKRPDYEWLREYRRVYTAAINKMTSDGWFVHGMSRLAARLWPRDPEAYPSSVLQNILDLGRHQVAIFEAWVTRRAVMATPEGAAAPDLAGSDLTAYEDALIHFVASWEGLEQIIVASYELRQSLRAGDEAYWKTSGASWPSLQAHMRNTAYFLAAVVWNEDLAGSNRFSDLLVRWVQTFYSQLQDLYPFRDALMLTPDLLRAPWPAAQAAAIRTLMYPQQPPGAKAVFGIVLREAYYDLLAITGAVLLHWFVTKQQPSSATANTAMIVLRRETLPDSGNTLLEPGAAAKTVFRLVFDLLVREALHSRSDEAKYSAYLEGLIQLLNEMATPRMIPGRIYGGFVLDGFQTLTPELLGILAGNLPAEGDEGVKDLIERLLDDHPEFRADSTLRDFGYQFGRYTAALDGDPDQRFSVTVERFVTDPDLETLRSRLKAIFDGVVRVIAKRRLQRIQEAPLDEARVKAVRDAVQGALLAETRPGGAFLPIRVSRTDRALEARETTFREMDRGSFTRPEMSGIEFNELPPIFVEFGLNFFRSIMWNKLAQRSKTIEKFDVQLGVAALLNRVRDIARDPNLGDELILLVPYNSVGEAIYMAGSGFSTEGLESYGLTREADAASGVGSTYAGTMGNTHIYSWQFGGVAVLCSRSLLRAAHFSRVHDLDTIFDFELYDSGDPTKSMVRMWLAAEFEWEDRLVIEFRFTSSSADGPVEYQNNPDV
jgi:hypothetical protein